MKIFCLLLSVLLLSGCAAPVWETVEDELPVLPVSSWLDEAYSVQLGVPDAVELLEERGDGKLYSTHDGALEIETRTFLSSGMESAVRTVSGFEAEELTILKLSRFGFPEYQFTWLAETEQGGRVYRAELVMDGINCYAVICSRPEAAGDQYDTEIRQVFSSFGLFTDEEV